jgi:3-oxoadipate enol-lactonase
MPIVEVPGAKISYEVAGDGPPLLLIMGFASDARMWMAQLPAFAPRYRCISFDNRGVRTSTAEPDPFSMADMATDAVAILDAEGIDAAHVVGISMGGAIAQHLALNAPSRVRSLTLAATWAEPNAYLRRMSEIGRILIASGGHDAVIRTSLLWLFTPRFILENDALLTSLEKMAAEFAVDQTVFDRQLDALLIHDTRDRLAELRMPVRVLCPRSDVFVPTVLCERLAAGIPGSDLVHIDGGHAFNVESVNAFNEAVLEFLDKN